MSSIRYGSVLLLLFASSTALANGRAPQTRDVHFQPGNDQMVLNPATFGLLVSKDDGASFHWVCEEAIGYGGQYDPDYSVATDGRIFATTFEGLRVTMDDGCNWTTLAGPWGTAFVGDVEIDSDGTVWAVAASAEVNGAYKSSNNGDSFTRVALDHPGAFWGTVRIADSDVQRVYIAGFVVPTEPAFDGGSIEPIPLLYRSDNGGTSWQQLPTTTFEFGLLQRIRLEAISPTDPNVVLASVPNAVEVDGEFNGDALYRSADGGMTWNPVQETGGSIMAVTFRANGTDLIVGTLDDGVRYSADGGQTFPDSAQQPLMACVGERSDGTLFSCGSNGDPDGFALARSSDGHSWTKVHDFSQIIGPLACGTETTQYQTCDVVRWCPMAAILGVADPDCGGDGGPSAIDAPPGQAADASTGGGGVSSCGGCSMLIGIAVFGFPLRRRRRRECTR